MNKWNFSKIGNFTTIGRGSSPKPILEQYIQQGYTELSMENLPELIKLKYSTINDAKAELGSLGEIKSLLDSRKGFTLHNFYSLVQGNVQKQEHFYV